MNTLPIRLAALATVLLVAAPTVRAQPLPTTSYQGYLEQNGQPVNDPNATLTFRLFRNANGGSALWTETKTGVAITDGVFNVALGNQTPLVNTLFDGLLFLSTAVGGTGAQQLSPRTVFRSVPYARTLSSPARITGSAPGAQEAVVRVENTAPSGLNYAVHAFTGSSEGRAVRGYATHPSGVNYGVVGQSESTSGTGVYGDARATSGTTYGVFGQSFSPSGTGVYGTAPSIGIWGVSAGTGVIGETADPDGMGVRGLNTAESGFTTGTYGLSFSPNGIGVYGLNLATTGGAYGVFGEGRIGVTGYTAASNGTGVYGYTAEVFGGTPYAIYGFTPPTGNGYAGFFLGRATVTGTLTKGGGAFEIDHPLDPEGRILRHSFVESPDMKNVYDGVATLDGRGEAVVALPSYFEALNRDFRYQLTCVGGYAPVYVAEEVQGNRFKIAGGTPGLRVSWQVTGVRQDAWANENRIVVEEQKPVEQRGRYLHPTAFGQPFESGVHYDPGREGPRTRSREEQARLDAARERHAVEPPPPHDQ